MSKSQKPYFSSDQVSTILDVFRATMGMAEREYDMDTLEAVETYVQSSKCMYENAILYGVLEGRYTFLITEGLATFGVKRPKAVEEFQLEYEAAMKALETATPEEKQAFIRKTQTETIEKGLDKLVVGMQDAEAKLSHAMHMISHYGRPKAGNINKFLKPKPLIAALV